MDETGSLALGLRPSLLWGIAHAVATAPRPVAGWAEGPYGEAV